VHPAQDVPIPCSCWIVGNFLEKTADVGGATQKKGQLGLTTDNRPRGTVFS